MGPGLYSSSRSQQVQRYIVAALKDHCKTQGIDDLGATYADVRLLISMYRNQRTNLIFLSSVKRTFAMQEELIRMKDSI